MLSNRLSRKPAAALDLAKESENPRWQRAAWCCLVPVKHRQRVQKIVFSFSYESQSITLKLRSGIMSSEAS